MNKFAVNKTKKKLLNTTEKINFSLYDKHGRKTTRTFTIFIFLGRSPRYDLTRETVKEQSRL